MTIPFFTDTTIPDYIAADGANQKITLDPNFLNNFIFGAPAPSVIENVFGDTPIFDSSTNTWVVKPNSQAAYDRFAALNPPAVLPPFPAFPSIGNMFKSAGTIIGLALVAIILIKR